MELQMHYFIFFSKIIKKKLILELKTFKFFIIYSPH